LVCEIIEIPRKIMVQPGSARRNPHKNHGFNQLHPPILLEIHQAPPSWPRAAAPSEGAGPAPGDGGRSEGRRLDGKVMRISPGFNADI
jgi:hypothetical protein